MTTYKIDKVGLVAHYSKQGDWAFSKAFDLAKMQNLQLNIFYFIRSSFDMPQDKAPKEIQTSDIPEKIIISEDRRLREYYDDILGDYVDVGFRVCESVRHNFELRLCLMKQEFNILFIPYLYKNVPFGNMPIEEFVFRFHAPIVLVGPGSKNQFYLNPPARLIVENISLSNKKWHLIEKPEKYQNLAVL